MLYINGSFLVQFQSGVQRYAFEVSKCILNEDGGKLLVKNTELAAKVPSQNVLIAEPGVLSRTVNSKMWGVWDVQRHLRSKDVLWHPSNIAAPLKGRHIVTIHDMAVYHGPSWFSKSFLAKYYAFLPFVAKMSRKILTVSEFSKREIVRYLRVPEDKVLVGYNGVSSGFSRANENEISALREKLKLSRPYFLSVGTQEPRKNIAKLIEAWKASGLGADYDLLLVGGKGRSFASTDIDYDALAADRILPLGYVEDQDLPTLYSGAVAFAYMSVYEGFGIPILEALSCGCPVLCSDIPVFRELFEGSASFADPFSVDEISQALRRMTTSQVRAFSRDELEARFSWQATGGIVRDVAKSLSS
jgi:glycosyltransferase involved in cell wall biosynthesis